MNRVFSGAQRFSSQTRRSLSTSAKGTTEKVTSRKWLAALAASGAVAGTVIVGSVALCSDDLVMTPIARPWSNNGFYSSFDAASLRRGYEVYRQVCSTCHSLKFLHFRQLVGVTHTEEQAKALAESFSYTDGPNDKGEMFERPGRLYDAFKPPYRNEEHARYVNNGAFPLDFSCIVKAREHGVDYIFALLTGYKDPPYGIQVREGLHYNPYFEGGAISMAKALVDGMVEFEDGTPATESQMAKDVSTFLAWCSEPESDERKKFGVRVVAAVALALLGAGYMKRFGWNMLKTRKISYVKDVPTATHTSHPKGSH